LPDEGTFCCMALARGHDGILFIAESGSDCSPMMGCSGTNFSHLDVVVYSTAARSTNLVMVEIELGVGRGRRMGLGGRVHDEGSGAGGAAAGFWRSPQGKRSVGRRIPAAGGAKPGLPRPRRGGAEPSALLPLRRPAKPCPALPAGPARGGGCRRGHAAGVASSPLSMPRKDRRPYHLLAFSRIADEG